jgi:hypothetical protein
MLAHIYFDDQLLVPPVSINFGVHVPGVHSHGAHVPGIHLRGVHVRVGTRPVGTMMKLQGPLLGHAIVAIPDPKQFFFKYAFGYPPLERHFFRFNWALRCSG